MIVTLTRLSLTKILPLYVVYFRYFLRVRGKITNPLPLK